MHAFITIYSFICFVVDDSSGRDNYVFESSDRIYPFKKRKFFNQTSSSTSDRGSHCHGIFDSFDTKTDGVNHSAGAKLHSFCYAIYVPV